MRDINNMTDEEWVFGYSDLFDVGQKITVFADMKEGMKLDKYMFKVFPYKHATVIEKTEEYTKVKYDLDDIEERFNNKKLEIMYLIPGQDNHIPDFIEMKWGLNRKVLNKQD